MDHTYCKIGIEMRRVRDGSVRPARFPCYNPEISYLCTKHESYTTEEIAKSEQQMAEAEREIAVILEKMSDLLSRKSEECLHCGTHIDQLKQVERSVYALPCGCRRYQGHVSSAWKER